MMRDGSRNGNWKGGISLFRCADEVLALPEDIQSLLRLRLLDGIKVDPVKGCWIWTGDCFSCNGRACLTLGKNRHSAARLAYALFRGPLGCLLALHSCDEVKCIRPWHLFLGTNQDNSSDMVAKGRSARGTANSGAKLTEEKVRLARRWLRGGVKPTVIARHLEVTSTCIYDIRSGKTWSFLE